MRHHRPMLAKSIRRHEPHLLRRLSARPGLCQRVAYIHYGAMRLLWSMGLRV